MQALTNEQLHAIHGGIGFWAVAGIISGITFIIGLLDGFVRPLKCN